jgi:hypothetical protein
MTDSPVPVEIWSETHYLPCCPGRGKVETPQKRLRVVYRALTRYFAALGMTRKFFIGLRISRPCLTKGQGPHPALGELRWKTFLLLR